MRCVILRDGPLWVTIGVVAMATVPAVSYYSGGVIFIGLGFGVLLSRKVTAPQGWGESTYR